MIHLISDIILPLFIKFNFFILIIGGLLAASWFLTRLVGVINDDNISNIVSKITIAGFLFGILSFITIGAAIHLISTKFVLPKTFDFFTFFCLVILGFVLILRPIKDFRFGTFLSLAIALLGAGFIIFLGNNSIKLLALIFFLLFLTIYGTIKLFEDLYLIIAEILSFPTISVSIGVLCIIQGLLEIIGVSIGGILVQFFFVMFVIY